MIELIISIGFIAILFSVFGNSSDDENDVEEYDDIYDYEDDFDDYD